MNTFRVELLYSLDPHVDKPSVPFLTSLSQRVKQEAQERVDRGESLKFRFVIADLLTINVWPTIEDAHLPRDRGNIEFVVKRKDTQASQPALAQQVEQFVLSELTYPAEDWRERYDSLVGLKEVKNLVQDKLLALFSEEYVQRWSRKYGYQPQMGVLQKLRYPVFIFEGPQGVGKTELAQAMGDPLARALNSPVVLYSIGLALRGGGLVGELSQNIAKIFDFAKLRHQQRGAPVLIHIDEGDAIGQKREDGQQHHEEQAAVSTLLEQIDALRHASGVALILTTNRHHALDTALQGRTNAHRVRFPLPDYGMRFYLLMRLLGDAIGARDLQTLAKATGGFSPRDIVELCQAAFDEARSKDSPITPRQLMHAATLISQLHHARDNGAMTSLKADHQKPREEHGVHVNGQTARNAMV
jgi:SpoVK/Ycf46/Vps4 family AAA+-type ATPase